MKQWAQSGTQEAPSDHQAALKLCAGDRALDMLPREAWSLLLGDLQTLPRHGTLFWVSLLE